MTPIPYERLSELETPDLSPLAKPRIHPACQKEILALYPNSSDLAVLKAQMEKRIQFWNEDPLIAKGKTDWFKPEMSITEGGVTYPCYSLRFNKVSGLGNLRILYLMDKDGMILMHAFQEKRSGNYAHAKKVVRERLKEG